MEAKGVAPGAWMRCPSCGQPVRFEAAKPPPRPKPAPKVAAVQAPLSPPTSKAWTPRPSSSRRLGCGPAAVIAMIAGFAEVFFVSTVLGVNNPFELLYSGLFGFVLAWFVGTVMLAASSRSGWDQPKDGPRF